MLLHKDHPATHLTSGQSIKINFAKLMRASQTRPYVAVSDFERKQLKLLRNELQAAFGTQIASRTKPRIPLANLQQQWDLTAGHAEEVSSKL